MVNGLVVGICKKCHALKIIDTFSTHHCDSCSEVIFRTDLSYSEYIKLDLSPDEMRKKIIQEYLPSQSQT